MDCCAAMGVLEKAQDGWTISIAIGVRFALATLAVIAVYTGVREIFTTRNAKREFCFTGDTYALFFVNRVLIAAAVLLIVPSAAFRLGYGQVASLQVIFWMQILANALLVIYFLISETIRLVLTEALTLHRAIQRSWLFVAAALALGLLGVWTATS